MVFIKGGMILWRFLFLRLSILCMMFLGYGFLLFVGGGVLGGFRDVFRVWFFAFL